MAGVDRSDEHHLRPRGFVEAQEGRLVALRNLRLPDRGIPSFRIPNREVRFKACRKNSVPT
jgi:hypothetical protein